MTRILLCPLPTSAGNIQVTEVPKMGNGYIFSLTPTFTQGLIFGQLSIIFLLIVILKYLFLESTPEASAEDTLSTPALLKERAFSRRRFAVGETAILDEKDEEESAAWFNLLLRKVSKCLSILYLLY